MSNYLLELSLIHLALMLGYFLFLRNERHYASMRFYLIGTTLLSLTIPWLKLPKLFFNSKIPMDTLPMEPIPLDVILITPTAEPSSWNDDLLIWMYTAISAFFLCKFFSSVLYLIYLERKSSYEKFDDLYIRKASNIQGSFTFFNWIFLSDKIDKKGPEYELILKHEKAHATMGHTYDIVFLELFKAGFWWLPTAWFISKEIKKIHEFQADAYALKSYSVDYYSSILISSTLKLNGLSLASSFHDGLILKRLLAMKQQVTNVSPWKLGALSALGTLLLVVFACSEELDPKSKEMEMGSQSNNMAGEVFIVVEEQPQYEGGMDAFYRYVSNEIKYPLQARQMGVEGRVDVEFVVERDGSLSNVKAIQGIDAGCDREAVRVVQKASSFKPGTQRGRPVRVRMVMPILFKLNKDKTNEDNSTQGIIVVEKAELKQEKLKVDASYASGAWSGRVYDEEGEGLPGVNIIVTGTTTGTVSDLEGNFSVKANESNDLSISFVGYESIRLKAK
ncbi:TonB family protein [Rhodocytophaga aerolata]|uniref:TonB family protein n=1 Tax=Rhodocytophaga aerolata TaxID=455078 RepID=A0ABT8RHS0_9BACT|nr:TonB family protein [Rhodocytophaga aerolata]MDO1451620.1 TonB family protein [Rhodocytophaga aerolata]